MQFIIDSHIHTDYSPDCKAKMEDIVIQAVELGLKKIIFTDHVDYDSPDELFGGEIDYNEYMKEIKYLRDKYKEIEILMGVEIGYQPHLNNKLDKFIKSYPFDFVICSMHSCDGLDLYNGDFFKGKTQRQSYMNYFESIKRCIENYDNYDVYGHLDYIVRYGNFDNKELKYEDFKKIIDEILGLIIEKGKGIEVNTAGFRYNLKTTHPNIDILRRYIEMGGKVITLGSDAHRPNELCSDFEKTIKILKGIGVNKIAQFKNRVPSFIEI
ncbi:histidinol-phosphatase HisJ family protein [Tepidibacter aestuarii]|uniref:histidinol-phosphatase HisJ family protein n=1 Tax=Tepidibacter aestuarii TaxID=2925782 RepID=UPI0020C171DB|nr:histidinol-phosphatase HisJ family protein [Tepidibacter aestuarii]CAH2213007.1 Histidinol-phosphatase [Tepidibacter aestuarii]